jgi:VIT1/CCC1 family predicted Fe2+/Mn2+ transporter
MTIEIHTRLVKIEQRVEGLIRELNEDKRDCRDTHLKIQSSLEELKKDAANNKGFFGGIVFAVGACFAVVAYAFGKS